MLTRADTLDVMVGSFPEDAGREGVAAASTGDVVYLLGGNVMSPQPTGELWKYTIATDTMELLNPTYDPPDLDPTRNGAAGIWDGTYAYFFGGSQAPAVEGDDPFDDILRYDPQANELRRIATRLPSARTDAAAAWDGTHAYLFGGHNAPTSLNEILRFTPATEQVAAMQATLPSGRWGASASYDGQHVYVFGGAFGNDQQNHTHINEFLKYDRATDTVTLLAAQFPSARHYMAAVSDGADPRDPFNQSQPFRGDYIYIFGGHMGDTNDDHEFTDDIWQYKPAADRLRQMGAITLFKTAWWPAAWSGDHAYLFAGYGHARDPLNQYFGGYLANITRYDVTPDPPENFTASPGPGLGEITSSWTRPYDDTVLTYDLFRSPVVEPPTWTLLAELPGTQLTYTDGGHGQGEEFLYGITATTDDYGFESAKNVAKGHAPDVPGPPQVVRAGAHLTGQMITVTWARPSDNGGMPITNYRIYDAAVDPPVQIAEVGVVFEYTHSCSPGVAYTYAVTAVNGVGEGGFSEEATTTCSMV